MIGNSSDMHMRKSLAVLAALAALLCSCSKDTDLKQNSAFGDDVMTSIKDTEIPCTGGGFTLVYTSGSTWKITNCPDWLEVSPTSGKAGATVINFSIGVNTDREDREANIVFQSGNGSNLKILNIYQKFPYLRISRDSLDFGWNSARTERPEVDVDTRTTTVRIESNVDWMFEEVPTRSADIDLNRFGISTMSGTGNQDVEFIPLDDNFSKNPYELKVRLFATYTDSDGQTAQIPLEAVDEYTVKLHQDNLLFLVNGSQDAEPVVIGELNNDENINLDIVSEVEWTVAECPDWIVLDRKSGIDTQTLNIRADGVNPTRETRSGVIRLGTVSGAYREINVSQKGYVLTSDVSRLDFPNEGDIVKKTINLNTSGGWEIKSVPEWMVVSPLEGEGPGEISVRVKDQNYDLADLSSEIKISSKLNDLYESVQVVQERFLFYLTYDSALESLPTSKIAPYSVTMHSSGAWELKDKPDWLDTSVYGAPKGDKSFEVTPNSGNPDTDSDRVGEVVFVSVAHRDRGETVETSLTVRQKKFSFKVDGSRMVSIPAYDPSFSLGSPSSTYYAVLDCSAGWYILQGEKAWLDADLPDPEKDEQEAVSDFKLRFTLQNNTGNRRSSTIYIQNTLNGERLSFKVTQEAFVFDDNEQTFNVPALNPGSRSVSFDLTKGVSWVIDKCDSWITPSVTKGTGSGSISFTLQDNVETTARSGQASIYCEYSGDTKRIYFEQEAYEFDSEAESISFSDTPASSEKRDIVCTGSWTARSSASWLSVSPGSGKGNGSITITAQNNTQETSRSATVTVTSSDNTSLKKVFTVTQEKHVTPPED